MDVNSEGKKLKPWVADVEIRREEPVKFFHKHYLGNEKLPLPMDVFIRASKSLGIDILKDIGFELLEKFVKRSGDSKVRAVTIAIQGNKMGVALCSVRDQFNREVGRRIAYGRMKKGQFTL